MFKTQRPTKTLNVNTNNELWFFEADAPYYSKLYLFHNGNPVSNCCFKPEDKNRIKGSLDSYECCIKAINTISLNANEDYLREFINRIETCKNAAHEQSPEKQVGYTSK